MYYWHALQDSQQLVHNKIIASFASFVVFLFRTKVPVWNKEFNSDVII